MTTKPPETLRRASSDLKSPTGASTKSSAVLNKLTTVLSASYADRDIRDALEALDKRGVQNTAETRRQLRMAVQGEVIQCNAEIVDNFGEIAEVIELLKHFGLKAYLQNTETKAARSYYIIS
jgi:hypothetical protein